MKLFLAALLMVGSPAYAGADGFTFGKAEYDQAQVQVEFVVFQSQPELQAAAEKLGAWTDGDRKIRAFSLLRSGGRCTIYMLNPGRDYQPEYVGHELLHCKYGRWHK